MHQDTHPTRRPESCPICQGTPETSLLALEFSKREALPRTIDVMACAHCDFAYVAPASQPAYDAYYATVRNDLVHDSLSAKRAARWVAIQASAFGEVLGRSTNLNVLDYGCGGGNLVRQLALLYPQHRYTGFDINIEVGDAESVETDTHVHFTNTIPNNQTFDVVILSHIVEHFVDFSPLASIGALLNKGGELYIEVPDASRYPSFPRREFLYYIDRLHVNHFSQKAMTILAGNYGLQVTRYGKLALPYKDGNDYPSHYFFCKKESVIEAVSRYIATEGERPSPLQEIDPQTPLLVYGFGDYFFRATAKGGPLEGHNIIGVIDRRWEELNHSEDGARYTFLSLEQALADYPHAPVAIALSWEAEQVAETIRAMHPDAQLVII